MGASEQAVAAGLAHEQCFQIPVRDYYSTLDLYMDWHNEPPHGQEVPQKASAFVYSSSILSSTTIDLAGTQPSEYEFSNR